MLELRIMVTRFAALAAVWLVMAFAPERAHASLLSPEAEDTLATVIAVLVIFLVPCVLIVLFWLVHILPEKIAHQRHHPQFEAIRTLCLLSLVFGGLLWPLAWIWAYSKPVLHKMAYGTDKADPDHGERVVDVADIGTRTLPDRIAQLEARGVPASELTALREQVAAIEAKFYEGKAS